jgi:hypothetical protein
MKVRVRVRARVRVRLGRELIDGRTHAAQQNDRPRGGQRLERE